MTKQCSHVTEPEILVNYFATGETDFKFCKKCGLVMRQPMPTLSELDLIYDKLYATSQIVDQQTEQESGNYALQQYAGYLVSSLISPDERVLDYGCGTGLLVEKLQMEGIRAIGVERSEGARNFSLSERDITLLKNVDEIEDQSLDIVLMIEVIEHLPDPMEAISALKRKLRQGGKLFLTTPNRRGLRAKLEKGHWREAAKKFHVVLFDASSMRQMLANAGYTQIHQIHFSPIQRKGWFRKLIARLQQAFGLSGSLCFIGHNPKTPNK